jgi:type I restriction enzyme S subunit
VKNGWPILSIGELCVLRPPKSEARKKLSDRSEVTFAPMEDLGIDTKRPRFEKARRLGDVDGSYTYFANGDVLLAKITPCFQNGKLGIAGDLRNGVGFGSSEFFVLRPSSLLDKDYLYYFLSRREFRENGVLEMGGAVGQQRVPPEFLLGQRLAVPPLAEQRRIVGILDAAFAGIATAKAHAQQNLQNARALFESHLHAVFTKCGEGWNKKPLAELCEIKHGFAFKSQFFTNEGAYVLLTPGNFFESGGYRDRGERQKYYVGEIPPGYVLAKGDMLVAMTEQAAGLLGSPILVPESGKFLHNQRLGLVVKKNGVPWTNEFFFHVFNTARVRKEIHDSASGVKVRHTSPSKIGEVIVSFPDSVSEQRTIVSRLQELSTATQQLESLYQRKLAALDELKQSLLHQAFSGQL